VIAQAFHASLDPSEEEASFAIVGTLSEVTDNFNKGDGKNSPFMGAGIMVNREVVTVDVEPKYNGHFTTLGEIIVDEKDVPPEFFIDGKALKEWKYLKGPKSEMRTTPEGFEYHYSEGGMAFPDSLDKPSRTIITGEGGPSPSRFKHVILTPSGRYRRLIPLELERLNMFPDNHTEASSDGKRAFLMGNALVTGIVERIGKVLKERM
jgi:DNA (cytosine-5)-methyltransferase 1